MFTRIALSCHIFVVFFDTKIIKICNSDVLWLTVICVFVPADTTDVTKYFVEVAGRNILYRYTIEYADRHREALNKVRTIPELQALLDSDKGLVEDFIRYAARKGVAPDYRDIARSRKLIEAQLRAYIGRNTALEDNGFYANIYPVDNVVVRAIGILNDTQKND